MIGGDEPAGDSKIRVRESLFALEEDGTDSASESETSSTDLS